MRAALPAGFRLKSGAHDAFESGACLLEAVAYVAGEEHSARPKCVSLVLASFGRAVNDGLDDDERQLLVPYIPRLIDTVSTIAHERRRECAIVDAVVHDVVPLALEAVGWQDLADRVRAITPIVDFDASRAACAVLDLARAEAWERCRAGRGVSRLGNAAQSLNFACVAALAPSVEAAANAAAIVDAADDIRRRIVEATMRAFARAIDTPAPELGAEARGLDELVVDRDATPASIRAESDDDVAKLLAEELTP